MGDEEFLLKWNDHHNSFFAVLQELSANDIYCKENSWKTLQLELEYFSTSLLSNTISRSLMWKVLPFFTVGTEVSYRKRRRAAETLRLLTARKQGTRNVFPMSCVLLLEMEAREAVYVYRELCQHRQLQVRINRVTGKGMENVNF